MYTLFADMCLNVHAWFHTVEGEGDIPLPNLTPRSIVLHVINFFQSQTKNPLTCTCV